MKMVKLTEEHYIVVDNSEITTGDIVAEKLLTGGYELFTIHTLNDIDKSSQEKITYSTQPESLGMGWMQSVLPLLLSEVKEVLGVVDVEKRAEEKIPNLPYKNYVKIGFIGGYNQALEDNKEKKYTEEDMVEAYKMGLMKLSDQRLKDYMLPKTEWEVEFVDGKLKLKS